MLRFNACFAARCTAGLCSRCDVDRHGIPAVLSPRFLVSFRHVKLLVNVPDVFRSSAKLSPIFVIFRRKFHGAGREAARLPNYEVDLLQCVNGGVSTGQSFVKSDMIPHQFLRI